MIRFFWDMDGVLYDFDEVFKKYMPGVEMENDEAWTWQELYAKCPDAYSIGHQMPGIKEVFDIARLFGDHYILTAIPKRWNWPNCCAQKRNWAVANFGFHPAKVRFGPFAVDKQFHCTGKYDVLIDDRIRNIEQWRERGGTGIHHTDPQETLDQVLKFITIAHS